MDKIEQILRSAVKPKEKQRKLVDGVCQGKISVKEFVTFFKSASDIDKGALADVMKHVSANTPGILSPYISTLIEYINYPLPRVRWGVPEAIGNLAKKYPEKVESAIPKLLLNAKEESTVVKWCAAYGLTEIAKYNPKARKQLLPIFSKIIKNEKNNGVKNIYIKALKFIEN